MRAFALLVMGIAAHGQTRVSKNSIPAEEQAAALRKLRAYAAQYTESLPNYTCIQKTEQTVVPHRRLGRRDLIEEQVSLVNHKEIHTVTKVNEMPVPPNRRQRQEGTFSRGEFGSLLATIVDPGSGADFQWTRMDTLNRRKVHVFAYHVPKARGYVLRDSKGQIQVPFQGMIYADAETGAVMRIELTCIEIPASSEYRAAELTLDYKSARVAGGDYILPSQFKIHYQTADSEGFTTAEYKEYRRFSADSSVSFGAGQQ